MPAVERLELRPGVACRVRRQAAPAPAAPALVLLAAWPQTLRSWDGHWSALADGRRHVVALELPGFGRTRPVGRELMRPSAQAALLAEALERLDLGEVVLVAPDVGVPVALRLAQDAPGHVRALVLFDGPGTARPAFSFEGRLLAASGLARAVTSALGIPFVLEITRRGYRRGWPRAEVMLDHLRSAASPRRFGGQLAFVGTYREELPALAARLGDVTVPVLLLWGAEDVFVLPAEGRALAAALPDATHHELAGCGHYAHEDAGPEFTRVVREWLDGVAA